MESTAVAAHAADEALLAAVRSFQAGHRPEAAFRVLFDHFHPPVRRFFARQGLSPEDALDLAQETFLGIYRGLKGFRGDARLSTWVFQIARTTWLKRLRSRSADKRAGVEVPAETIEPAEPAVARPAAQLDSMLDDERRRQLDRAVRRLPEQMRRALLLRIGQDLKYRQIAEEMDVSIDTVKAHLFQARQRLKAELADLADGAFEPGRAR